jgi:hypothetical protein
MYVTFSKNLCGSYLYIIYCLISNAVQLVLLAFCRFFAICVHSVVWTLE